MRLGYGVNGFGQCFVVDDNRSPHKAIAGPMTQFEAITFIQRLKRKLNRRQSDTGTRRQNDTNHKPSTTTRQPSGLGSTLQSRT